MQSTTMQRIIALIVSASVLLGTYVLSELLAWIGSGDPRSFFIFFLVLLIFALLYWIAFNVEEIKEYQEAKQFAGAGRLDGFLLRISPEDRDKVKLTPYGEACQELDAKEAEIADIKSLLQTYHDLIIVGADPETKPEDLGPALEAADKLFNDLSIKYGK